MRRIIRTNLWVVSAVLAGLLAGCGNGGSSTLSAADQHPVGEHDDHADGHDGHDGHDEHDEHDEHGADFIELDDSQIAAAGIETAPVRRGSADAITLPATVTVAPERSAVVAAAVGGRIATLLRNPGEAVDRGAPLAVIQSREAAELRAELDAAREQLALAESILQREQHLFAEKVSPEQDLIAARAGAAQARIRVDLAWQRLAVAGGAEQGDSSRLQVRAPLSGHVLSRAVVPGQMVHADDELFRVADLSMLSVELALPPDSAAAVEAGRAVTVSSAGRQAQARITFVSPMIDPYTRQVRATAALPNADGIWRVGDTVQATLPLTGANAEATLTVPKQAVQTVEDKPSVFVRSAGGFAVRHLRLGPASGDQVVVLAGLDGDEHVATVNSYVLKAELGKGDGGGHVH